MEVTINIDGQALSVEVTVEVYEYLDRADHKEENLAHEKRRHWDSREFDEYIVLTEGRSCYYQTPEQWVCRKETMLEIKAALALCTEVQRRRFLLYALEGLSLCCLQGLLDQSQHELPLGQLPASALGLALQVGFDPLEKGFRDLEGHRSAVVSHSRFTSVFLHFVVFE